MDMLRDAEKTVENFDLGGHVLPRCMHSDIQKFVGQVCEELCMLYPVANTDPASVLRIFKQHLEHKKHKQARLEPGPAARADAASADAVP